MVFLYVLTDACGTQPIRCLTKRAGATIWPGPQQFLSTWATPRARLWRKTTVTSSTTSRPAGPDDLRVPQVFPGSAALAASRSRSIVVCCVVAIAVGSWRLAGARRTAGFYHRLGERGVLGHHHLEKLGQIRGRLLKGGNLSKSSLQSAAQRRVGHRDSAVRLEGPRPPDTQAGQQARPDRSTV